MSTSDSSGSGAYVWNLGGQSVYVLSGLFAWICHIVKDITINCLRSGATSQTYPVPNSDNSAAGDYTCMVTVSALESSESTTFSLGVTGILTIQIIYTISDHMYDTIYICTAGLGKKPSSLTLTLVPNSNLNHIPWGLLSGDICPGAFVESFCPEAFVLLRYKQ